LMARPGFEPGSPARKACSHIKKFTQTMLFVNFNSYANYPVDSNYAFVNPT